MGGILNPKGRELVLKACEEKRDTGNMTIAKMLYKKYPEVWPSLDAARAQVGYYRGAKGNQHRNELSIKKYIGDGLGRRNIPGSDQREWGPRYLQPFDYMLVCGDIHIPYHSPEAIELMLDYAHGPLKEAKEGGCIVLLGDIWDMHRLSFYSKDPTARSTREERERVIQFLAALRDAYPDATIVYKEGNHEERWTTHIKTKSPEFFDFEDFKLPKVLKLDELDIQWVGDKRTIYYGQLNMLHGHEFARAITSPVNPARGLFLRTHCTTIGAHHHQTSMHEEGNLRGKPISCWSIGTLGELHPEYLPNNRWNAGFAVLTGGHKFVLDNKRIVKGQVV